MKSIKLSKGRVTVVDDEDFEYLNQWKWFAYETYGKFYAARTAPKREGGRRTIYMHRVILDVPGGMSTDHIDGDTLNNTRANLRPCTRFQNMANMTSRPNTTSKYKGVTRQTQCKERWQAQIRVNGNPVYLGLYPTQEQAARTYDDAARTYHGEFARLNFPSEGEQHAVTEQQSHAAEQLRRVRRELK